MRNVTFLGPQSQSREEPVEKLSGGKNATDSAEPLSRYERDNDATRTRSWQRNPEAAQNRAFTSSISSPVCTTGDVQTRGEEFGNEIVTERGPEDLSAMVALEERRKRKRIALHWPVRLFRDPAAPSVESTTENLTSNGFYCISKEPFELGERLECIIAIPAGSFGYNESPIRLQCRVRVARVEGQQEGFGLGCYIEDYDLLTNSRSASGSLPSSQPLC